MGWRARERSKRFSHAAAAEQFEITMFGEEPTGNYNRILLSNVLNGSYKEDEIFLNPLTWYEENNIRLHVGKTRLRSASPRAARIRRRRPAGALRQADYRHRKPAFHSADGRIHHA